MMAARAVEASEVPRWKKWLIQPVVNQLTHGATPDRLAWTISAGVVLGLFPIMGSTTLVCLLVGWPLGLNQAVLQVFKAAVYPLHLALILVFIRLGEKLHGAPLLSLSIPQLLARFKDDPLQFARDFGLAAWHGVTAWLLVAPVLLILIKWAVTPALRAWRVKLDDGKDGVR